MVYTGYLKKLGNNIPQRSKKESVNGYSAACQEGIGAKGRKENGDKS